MKKFIALTLTGLALVAMTSAPADAKAPVKTATTFSTTVIPGVNFCC